LNSLFQVSSYLLTCCVSQIEEHNEVEAVAVYNSYDIKDPLRTLGIPHLCPTEHNSYLCPWYNSFGVFPPT
jgi:hypothetical protein